MRKGAYSIDDCQSSQGTNVIPSLDLELKHVQAYRTSVKMIGAKLS